MYPSERIPPSPQKNLQHFLTFLPGNEWFCFCSGIVCNSAGMVRKRVKHIKLSSRLISHLPIVRALYFLGGKVFAFAQTFADASPAYGFCFDREAMWTHNFSIQCFRAIFERGIDDQVKKKLFSTRSSWFAHARATAGNLSKLSALFPVLALRAKNTLSICSDRQKRENMYQKVEENPRLVIWAGKKPNWFLLKADSSSAVEKRPLVDRFILLLHCESGEKKNNEAFVTWLLPNFLVQLLYY